MEAWIKMIDASEASGDLAAAYDRLGAQPAHILKVHSLFPASLEAHLEYYKTVMFGRSPLSRAQREMIATVVSAANECGY